MKIFLYKSIKVTKCFFDENDAKKALRAEIDEFNQIMLNDPSGLSYTYSETAVKTVDGEEVVATALISKPKTILKDIHIYAFECQGLEERIWEAYENGDAGLPCC